MNQSVKNDIGCLIITEETINRNRNRMIMYLEKGDIEGAMALIKMQKDDCWRYMEYLRNLRNEIEKQS
jgi:hypothetical protein